MSFSKFSIASLNMCLLYWMRHTAILQTMREYSDGVEFMVPVIRCWFCRPFPKYSV